MYFSESLSFHAYSFFSGLKNDKYTSGESTFGRNDPIPEELNTTFNSTQSMSYTRGRFLESPGDFSGPKSNIQIEIYRKRARVVASKLRHFVSLTDSFIMLDAKLLKPLSCM